MTTGKVKRSKTSPHLTKAAKKNTNALTVERQKRKAKSIAKKAAKKLDQRGIDNTTGIMARLIPLGGSNDVAFAKKRLKRAKRGRKQLMDAARIRKAAAKIK
jgi:hypothetical protein